MKLKKKTRRKIREKRTGNRDKKLKETLDAKIDRVVLSFLLIVDSLEINPVGPVLSID